MSTVFFDQARAGTTAGTSSSATNTIRYNPAGERTQMAATVDGTADFVDDYAYNSLGQVVSVTQHAAASPLPPGEGQGEGGGLSQVSSDETGTVPLAAPGNVVWPLTDNLGTVRDLAQYNPTTQSTTVVAHRVYSAYGQLISQTNPSNLRAAAVDCLFGFTGRPFDPATGLQNNLNRWYDPATGNWLTQDPTGFAAGDTNLYRYCGNSPANATDPTGRNWFTQGVSDWWIYGDWNFPDKPAPRPTPPPPPVSVGGHGDPYLDGSVGGGCIVGVVGGVQTTGPGESHPYFGGGLTTPGICAQECWASSK